MSIYDFCSNETIHIEDNEETNQNIEVLKNHEVDQKRKTTTINQRRAEDHQQKNRQKQTTKGTTTHICHRNHITTFRS